MHAKTKEKKNNRKNFWLSHELSPPEKNKEGKQFQKKKHEGIGFETYSVL